MATRQLPATISFTDPVTKWDTTDNTAELVSTLPIRSGALVSGAVDYLPKQVFKINIGPVQVGDDIEAKAYAEFTNDKSYVVSVPTLLILSSNSAAAGNTGVGIVELSEAKGDNIDQSITHHHVAHEQGWRVITTADAATLGAGDSYVIYTGWAVSTAWVSGDNVTVDQDYGQMRVTRTRYESSSELPDPTGQNGKFLCVSGDLYTLAGLPDNIPSVSAGTDGKVLSNDGSTLSWVVAASGGGGGGGSFVAATGGTITTDGDYKVHTFTTGGTFTVTNGGDAGGSNTVDYLVVGGGGGGGASGGASGGGGGAGRFLTGTAHSVTAQTYTIVVGSGGTGASAGNNQGSSGGTSSFDGISAAGGGGGGAGSAGAGATGGSGGGGGTNSGSGGASNGTGTSAGGSAQNNGSFRSGGGGGSGGAGVSGTTGVGNGGSGTSSSITGSAVSYAGGGGGGSFSDSTGGTGASGGGNGAGSAAGPTSGSANSGSGGGGTKSSGSGGNGGSGVVIIRYKFQ